MRRFYVIAFREYKSVPPYNYSAYLPFAVSRLFAETALSHIGVWFSDFSAKKTTMSSSVSSLIHSVLQALDNQLVEREGYRVFFNALQSALFDTFTAYVPGEEDIGSPCRSWDNSLRGASSSASASVGPASTGWTSRSSTWVPSCAMDSVTSELPRSACLKNASADRYGVFWYKGG